VQYEIKTTTIEPKRNAFKSIEARFGPRPASRYEEVSYDVQPLENFHYRPRWAPDHQIFDPTFSQLRLSDWDDYRDPRQYYYASYNLARAQALEVVRANFTFLEDHGLVDKLDPAWVERAMRFLPAMRHYEYGAMLVLADVGRFAFGTAITQAMSFACFDRMGNSELLTRWVILLSDDPDATLRTGKEGWLSDPAHQDLRAFIERLWVVRDWGEQLVGLYLALDVKLHRLLFGELAVAADQDSAVAMSLCSRYFDDWQDNDLQWVRALLLALVKDPEHGAANKELISGWLEKWRAGGEAAIAPYGQLFDGTGYEGGSSAALANATGARDALLSEAGLG
jgi:phenol hydroxylase P1 protein